MNYVFLHTFQLSIFSPDQDHDNDSSKSLSDLQIQEQTHLGQEQRNSGPENNELIDSCLSFKTG